MLSFFRKKDDVLKVGAVRSVIVSSDVSQIWSDEFWLWKVSFVYVFRQEVFNPTLKELGYRDDEDLKAAIYDLLRTIKDPEKPSTLEVRAIWVKMEEVLLICALPLGVERSKRRLRICDETCRWRGASG